jgi:hypothetical protein
MPGPVGLTSGVVISEPEIRDIVLSLPGSHEADHWGNPSFRVRDRIYATMPDPQHLNVMIDPFDVDAVIREDPEACSQLWWGKELRGVRVNLRTASRELVASLLESAWRRKAPASVSSRSAKAAPRSRRSSTNRPKV